MLWLSKAVRKEKVERSGRRFIITQNGKPAAIVADDRESFPCWKAERRDAAMSKTALIFVMLFLIARVPIAAENTMTSQEGLYELQEKCSKKADDFVVKKKGEIAFSDYDCYYSAHYNKKLNKCFVNIRIHKPGDGHGSMTGYYLYDVNENILVDMYGYFSPSKEDIGRIPEICEKIIQDNVKALKSFTVRIKPYMSE
jgi:hypothetical protein